MKQSLLKIEEKQYWPPLNHNHDCYCVPGMVPSVVVYAVEDVSKWNAKNLYTVNDVYADQVKLSFIVPKESITIAGFHLPWKIWALLLSSLLGSALVLIVLFLAFWVDQSTQCQKGMAPAVLMVSKASEEVSWDRSEIVERCLKKFQELLTYCRDSITAKKSDGKWIEVVQILFKVHPPPCIRPLFASLGNPWLFTGRIGG